VCVAVGDGIGYARVSTADQDPQLHPDELTEVATALLRPLVRDACLGLSVTTQQTTLCDSRKSNRRRPRRN